MTKKLEEFFDVPPIDKATPITSPIVDIASNIASDVEIVDNGLSISEKINTALKQIKSQDDHSAEMDDISKKALDSYSQLMSLGMNVSDMAAGKIFAEASTFLKLALESSDAKARTRATELDLMLKKLRIDRMSSPGGDNTEELGATQVFDRNDLLKIMKATPPALPPKTP